MSHVITVIPGDGIGPELMTETLRCLGAAQMLTHLGMDARARKLRSAIRETIVSGDRVTPDLGGHGTTTSIADAIIERLKA